MGFLANSGFHRILDSEISAFEAQRLPKGAGGLEESAVDQGIKARMGH
jgi:hypothetical protein